MLDITNAAAIAAAAQAIGAEVGDRGLAGLVNNAGIGVMGPLEFVPIDRLRLQLEVNLIGHVAVTQACLPLLRKATGRIVNISSLAGRMSMPMLGPYSASKYAIEAVSDALRQELAPWKMHVACIEPALINTPILAGSQQAAEMAFVAIPPARPRALSAIFRADATHECDQRQSEPTRCRGAGGGSCADGAAAKNALCRRGDALAFFHFVEVARPSARLGGQQNVSLAVEKRGLIAGISADVA